MRNSETFFRRKFVFIIMMQAEFSPANCPSYPPPWLTAPVIWEIKVFCQGKGMYIHARPILGQRVKWRMTNNKMGGNIPGENFLGGNFSGRNFPGGSLMGGNFSGGNFPRTMKKVVLQKADYDEIYSTRSKLGILYGSAKIHNPALEAVVQRCSVKKIFLKISRNSQENTCARVSWCFPMNFVKFLRTPISIEYHWWLLLYLANF